MHVYIAELGWHKQAESVASPYDYLVFTTTVSCPRTGYFPCAEHFQQAVDNARQYQAGPAADRLPALLSQLAAQRSLATNPADALTELIIAQLEACG